MSWVRLDDRFFSHRKVLSISVQARWLYVSALCVAAQHNTDGLIDAAGMQLLLVSAPAGVEPLAAELVKVGLWDVVPNGYQIHDYLEYQLSAEEQRKERAANAERMKRFRKNRAERNAVTNGDTNGEQTPLKTVPRPVPSRINKDLKSFAGGSSPTPLPALPKVPEQTSLLPDPPKTKPPRPKKSPPEAPTASAWAAYAEGYRKRYGADPVRNAKVNSQLSSLVKDYGGDAERLVAFYLARDGQNYTRDYHPIWALLRDAQKLHTEMRTGRAAADPPPAWRPPEKAKPYRPPYFDPVVPMKFNRLPPTPEEEAAAREALHALRERTAPTEAPPEGQP